VLDTVFPFGVVLAVFNDPSGKLKHAQLTLAPEYQAFINAF